MSTLLSSPAVFFDRDGTLMEDADYCRDPKQVRIFEGASDALRRVKENGFRLVLITNQSGIGRGYFTETDFQLVQAEFSRQIGAGLINASYHCPDAPGVATERRKPAPGMILEAAHEHNLDLTRSYMVGDKAIDVECGRRAGLAGSVLMLTGKGGTEQAKCQADFIARDLAEAADWILQQADLHHG